MHPILLVILDRLFPRRSTREVLGFDRSVARQLAPHLDALTPHTPADLDAEIRAEAASTLRECLTERGVRDGIYELVVPTEGALAFVVRKLFVHARVSKPRAHCLEAVP